jgi:hypothetical protein
VLKVVISILFSCVLVYFVKYFGKDKLSSLQYLIIIVFEIMLSLSTVQIKSYTLSSIFFALELILLNKYKDNPCKKYIIYSCILVLLWYNMHSGSVILYFVVAGLYLLFSNRKQEVIKIGVLNILCLFISPYNIQLLLTDIIHINIKGDKYFTTEWQSIGTDTAIGIVVCLLILSLIFLSVSYYNKNNGIYNIILLLLSIFLMMSAIRHEIYFLFVAIIIITSLDLNKSIEIFDEVIRPLSLILILIIVCTEVYTIGFTDYESEQYKLDSKVETLIKENNPDGVGLLTDIETIKYNIPEFCSCVFLPCSTRWTDFRYIMTSGNSSDIAEFIKYYEITSIFVPKYNLTYKDPKYNIMYSSLYNYYLENIEDFELVYEDDVYVYYNLKKA